MSDKVERSIVHLVGDQIDNSHSICSVSFEKCIAKENTTAFERKNCVYEYSQCMKTLNSIVTNNVSQNNERIEKTNPLRN